LKHEADLSNLPPSVPKNAAAKAKRAKGTKRTGSAADGQAALVRELWQAAVNLRGAIEPPDYKRYVLPIIFLRYLSLRYERRHEELKRLVEDPQSDYYQLPQVLDDQDEYRAVGAFVVPAKARWEHLRKNAQADDIKVILDDALEVLEKAYPAKLRGLLPRIYAGSNLARENVTGLINLFSKDVFAQDHGGLDLVGLIYEYFIGEFANSEGKRGGEYFTPKSIVRTLVAMLEPQEGIVFDPCCGSGGMFVQSDVFAGHRRRLSFHGQESKDFTYRLCRMNLFIHGLDGDIELGNSYFDDKHADLKADYVLANPPFNDGSKGEHGWGADRVPDKDSRLVLGTDRMPLSPRNANTMWILHFLHHLKEGGTAGFVMATGELSNNETARYTVRKTLIGQGYVDAIVQLSGQLFANTQIPCSLWLLSRNREGQNGYRKRTGEILFIDGRQLGSLIPGSRKQKQLSEEEIGRIAAVYRTYKRERAPDEVRGFCRAAPLEEIRQHDYALTPGRYVGSADGDEDEEAFEVKFARLVKELEEGFQTSGQLADQIKRQLAALTNAS
jgi:type I restriction enzyme M protein